MVIYIMQFAYIDYNETRGRKLINSFVKGHNIECTLITNKYQLKKQLLQTRLSEYNFLIVYLNSDFPNIMNIRYIKNHNILIPIHPITEYHDNSLERSWFFKQPLRWHYQF